MYDLSADDFCFYLRDYIQISLGLFVDHTFGIGSKYYVD